MFENLNNNFLIISNKSNNLSHNELLDEINLLINSKADINYFHPINENNFLSNIISKKNDLQALNIIKSCIPLGLKLNNNLINPLKIAIKHNKNQIINFLLNNNITINQQFLENNLSLNKKQSLNLKTIFNLYDKCYISTPKNIDNTFKKYLKYFLKNIIYNDYNQSELTLNNFFLKKIILSLNLFQQNQLLQLIIHGLNNNINFNIIKLLINKLSIIYINKLQNINLNLKNDIKLYLQNLINYIKINKLNLNLIKLIKKNSKIIPFNSIKQLINEGADIYHITKKNNTLLHISSISNQFNIVQWLLNSKYKNMIYFKNNLTMTPLNYLCSSGYIDYRIFKSLIDSKSNINTLDKLSNTPLYYSVLDNNFDCVKYLINQGAITSIKNKELELPIDLAINYGNKQIINLLNKSKILNYNKNINFKKIN